MLVSYSSIRPGRIDKIIKMDFIRAEEALEMVAHYFPQEAPLSSQHMEQVTQFLQSQVSLRIYMQGDEG